MSDFYSLLGDRYRSSVEDSSIEPQLQEPPEAAEACGGPDSDLLADPLCSDSDGDEESDAEVVEQSSLQEELPNDGPGLYQGPRRWSVDEHLADLYNGSSLSVSISTFLGVEAKTTPVAEVSPTEAIPAVDDAGDRQEGSPATLIDGSPLEARRLFPDEEPTSDEGEVTNDETPSVNPYDSLGTLPTQTSAASLPKLPPSEKTKPLWNNLNVMRAVRWRSCRPHKKLKVHARITSTGLKAPGHWTQYTRVKSAHTSSRQRLPILSPIRSRPTTAPQSHLVRSTCEHGPDVTWFVQSDGPLGPYPTLPDSNDSISESLSPLRSMPRPMLVPSHLQELPAATVLPSLNVEQLLRSACKLEPLNARSPSNAAKAMSSKGDESSADAEDPFAMQKLIAAVGRVARRRVLEQTPSRQTQHFFTDQSD